MRLKTCAKPALWTSRKPVACAVNTLPGSGWIAKQVHMTLEKHLPKYRTRHERRSLNKAQPSWTSSAFQARSVSSNQPLNTSLMESMMVGRVPTIRMRCPPRIMRISTSCLELGFIAPDFIKGGGTKVVQWLPRIITIRSSPGSIERVLPAFRGAMPRAHGWLPPGPVPFSNAVV